MHYFQQSNFYDVKVLVNILSFIFLNNYFFRVVTKVFFIKWTFKNSS